MRAARLASSGALVARTRAGAAREAAPAADARALRAAAFATGDAAAAAAVEALPMGPAKAHLLAAIEQFREAEAAREADAAEAALTLHARAGGAQPHALCAQPHRVRGLLARD